MIVAGTINAVAKNAVNAPRICRQPIPSCSRPTKIRVIEPPITVDMTRSDVFMETPKQRPMRKPAISAPHCQCAIEQYHHAQQPKRSPKIVRAEFNRTKTIIAGKSHENGCPDADAPRKKQRSDPIGAPEGDNVERLQDDPHPVENDPAVGDQLVNRSA